MFIKTFQSIRINLIGITNHNKIKQDKHLLIKIDHNVHKLSSSKHEFFP